MANQLFDQKMLAMALEEARAGSQSGEGGPFGAVITDEGGRVLSAAHNQVLAGHDPTAHAEIQAIRQAAASLGSHDLTGCTLYTSCEPCPMCLAAIIWAGIRRVVYGCTREDAATIGFRDEAIYDYLAGRGEAPLELLEMDRDLCRAVFAEYQQRQGELY